MPTKKNVGFVDQIIRALLVLDLIILSAIGLVPNVLMFLVISIVLVLTISCVTCHCWVYDLFGLSTRQKANS
ncbi:DUF2892 domain-containing protein [Spirosoma taeanense]|uniref:DUF2892 domain-containing protein n=1 Tax=Spirosoma taeanense TaxID=2735870 RepID=A0A6M5Y6W8_9BACT|nr:DUF2892 domain-containing protein [Spirosoma taeanense]QJW89635.1 DUF2892 domain-containing protein [Spirosoma taeanense]